VSSVALFLFVSPSFVASFSSPGPGVESIASPPLGGVDSVATDASSRRDLLKKSSLAFLSVVAGWGPFANEAHAKAAGGYPQEASDKEKIVKGYTRLEYLLQNWEKETTICGRSDNPYQGCERTPEKVMQVRIIILEEPWLKI